MPALALALCQPRARLGCRHELAVFRVFVSEEKKLGRSDAEVRDDELFYVIDALPSNGIQTGPMQPLLSRFHFPLGAERAEIFEIVALF